MIEIFLTFLTMSVNYCTMYDDGTKISYIISLIKLSLSFLLVFISTCNVFLFVQLYCLLQKKKYSEINDVMNYEYSHLQFCFSHFGCVIVPFSFSWFILWDAILKLWLGNKYQNLFFVWNINILLTILARRWRHLLTSSLYVIVIVILFHVIKHLKCHRHPYTIEPISMLNCGVWVCNKKEKTPFLISFEAYDVIKVWRHWNFVMLTPHWFLKNSQKS